MTHQSTPEGLALNAVCEYLHMQGYSFFRVNNGGVYDPTKDIMRRPAKWTVKGVSDLIVIWKGQTFFIEVKSSVGKLSADQEAFCAMIEDNGCDYHVVRGVEDIQRIFPRHA